jgi:NAD(P)H dehydrogenase (quinone)
MNAQVKVAVIYYSLYGSTYRLAKAVAEGAEGAGATVRLRKVAETIPESLWRKLPGVPEAKEMQKDVPEATLEDLEWADGLALGSPTRFGNMCGQMRNFLDQTGRLYAEGKLYGKPVGFFTGADTMHGGHETTILTMSTFAYHHGMLIVPVGYIIPEAGSTKTGGGPYGPSHYSSQAKIRELDEAELKIARHLGKRIAEVAAKLKA